MNAALKKQKPAGTSAPARTGGGAAVVVSVLALLVALAASAVAVYALDQAREAKSRAAATAINPAPPAASATTAPEPTASATPTASPTPQFINDLLQARLRVPGAVGCKSSFVDVDSMVTGVDAGHDLYLTSCLGPQTLQFDQTQAAAVTSPGATAQACASQLAGITQTQEVPVLVNVGTTICLLTSKAAATSQGIPQRIAILEVTSVGSDRSVVLSVSTFRVPEQS